MVEWAYPGPGSINFWGRRECRVWGLCRDALILVSLGPVVLYLLVFVAPTLETIFCFQQATGQVRHSNKKRTPNCFGRTLLWFPSGLLLAAETNCKLRTVPGGA